MYKHVTSAFRAAHCHLKNIHCLKAFLTQETLVTVVHTFVTSRIDYCNSLLYGISDYNINRFQRIQNGADRIVTNTQKYDNIPQILQILHWLLVRQRIHFKIWLITYKSINNMAPEYLCELVSIKSHPENSGNPVRCYYRCWCLGSSDMVIAHLVLQHPICGMGYRQILETVVCWKF